MLGKKDLILIVIGEGVLGKGISRGVNDWQSLVYLSLQVFQIYELVYDYSIWDLV